MPEQHHSKDEHHASRSSVSHRYSESERDELWKDVADAIEDQIIDVRTELPRKAETYWKKNSNDTWHETIAKYREGLLGFGSSMYRIQNRDDESLKVPCTHKQHLRMYCAAIFVEEWLRRVERFDKIEPRYADFRKAWTEAASFLPRDRYSKLRLNW